MKITKYSDKEDWLQDRRGRIGGSSLKNLIVKRGTEQKKGYYQLIADRLTVDEDGNENPMDRGNRLEQVALDLFIAEMAKDGIPESEWVTELVTWEHKKDRNIYISPDGYHKKLKKAIEVKCLNSADHIKAYITKKIPKDYEDQALQYFIVNKKLETLYFVMYDPRFSVASFFYIIVERDVEKVEAYLKQEQNILQSVDEQVEKITSGICGL